MKRSFSERSYGGYKHENYKGNDRFHNKRQYSPQNVTRANGDLFGKNDTTFPPKSTVSKNDSVENNGEPSTFSMNDLHIMSNKLLEKQSNEINVLKNDLKDAKSEIESLKMQNLTSQQNLEKSNSKNIMLYGYLKAWASEIESRLGAGFGYF